MSSVDTATVDLMIRQIDRMIDELTAIRRQLASLNASARPRQTVRGSEYFGMWAGREDMRGLSSREWLAKIRGRQWGPTMTVWLLDTTILIRRSRCDEKVADFLEGAMVNHALPSILMISITVAYNVATDDTSRRLT